MPKTKTSPGRKGKAKPLFINGPKQRNTMPGNALARHWPPAEYGHFFGGYNGTVQNITTKRKAVYLQFSP